MSFFILKAKSVGQAQKVIEKSIKDVNITEDQVRDLIASRINDFLPSNEMMVVSTEFSSWADSSRRLDILALDKAMNLVVFELKRDANAAHAELQAIRYAAMLSVCTVDDIISAGIKYSEKLGQPLTNEQYQVKLKEFLQIQDISTEVRFGKIPKIVLISSGFSKEITTTVMWLNENFGALDEGMVGMNISCYEVKIYEMENDYGLHFDQIIPVTESEDYLIKARAKEIEGEKQAAEKRRQRTWVILQEKGLLTKDQSKIFLKSVPGNIADKVQENQKMATYTGEGKFRWDFNGIEYPSLTALAQALYESLGVTMSSLPIPDYWAREGSNKSLSDEAKDF